MSKETYICTSIWHVVNSHWYTRQETYKKDLQQRITKEILLHISFFHDKRPTKGTYKREPIDVKRDLQKRPIDVKRDLHLYPHLTYRSSTTRDLQNRPNSRPTPTKQTYKDCWNTRRKTHKKDLQQRLSKETESRMSLPHDKRPAKETYRCQKRPTTKTYKRDLQKRQSRACLYPTTKDLQKRPIDVKRDLQKRPIDVKRYL